jgi:endogenous inhibitor of DNA gyrase (YacG/DUF329 family)
MQWSERIRPCAHCHRQFDRGAVGRLRFCSLRCAEQAEQAGAAMKWQEWLDNRLPQWPQA